MKLYWGIAADGSVVISDDLDVIKEGCAKSFAPFPTGNTEIFICFKQRLGLNVMIYVINEVFDEFWQGVCSIVKEG